MRMVPYDKTLIKIRKNTDNFKLLMDFKNSELDCVRLEDHNWVNAKSAQNSLTVTMKRYGIEGIKAIIRRGEIYLIKMPII